MSKGYSYLNDNGVLVRGRAADIHWLSEHGYNNIYDLIDDVACQTAYETAKQVASKFKAESDEALLKRNKIKYSTRIA